MPCPLSLYRSTIRQAGYLPHPYLQQFVKDRTRDYFRRHRNAAEPHKYLKRAEADLRRLQRLNRGERKPFMQLLRQAYGRAGRLKRELLQVAESYPEYPKREPIIPNDDKSRPPAYTETLMALVVNPISKTTGSMVYADQVMNPRTLPDRANPNSEDAKLLGPFSLRRVKNIHRRFFKEQTSRVLPPLEVSSTFSDSELKALKFHVPKTGLEKFTPVKKLIQLASPLISTPNLPPEEATKGATFSPMRLGNKSQRWLRRRYRELLAEIPQVTIEPSSLNSSSSNRKGRHQRAHATDDSAPSAFNHQKPLLGVRVNWSSPLVLSRNFPSPLRSPTDVETKWIEKAKGASKGTKSSSISK
ncbi:hypothetical protein CPB86DRAFT_575935 [Serendipita vermifera]|nr:hypothetical protein CPB86DRAFT_575935 [Serendipita vermifera]